MRKRYDSRNDDGIIGDVTYDAYGYTYEKCSLEFELWRGVWLRQRGYM